MSKMQSKKPATKKRKSGKSNGGKKADKPALLWMCEARYKMSSLLLEAGGTIIPVRSVVEGRDRGEAEVRAGKACFDALAVLAGVNAHGATLVGNPIVHYPLGLASELLK